MISGHREIEQRIRSLTLQAESTLDPEFVHALRTCDAAAAVEGPLTFLPTLAASAKTWGACWQSWLSGQFAEVLAPALLSAARYAHAGQFREIAALDLALTGSLEVQAASRSNTAGRKMLKRLSGTRGVRWLDRLQAAADAGTTPGHFAVAYGCQGALFHLAPRLILTTYTYWEWSAAVVAGGHQRDGAITAFQTASARELQRITEEMLTSLTISADASSRALP